ncbi:uncharacterized protein AB675_10831 [Cyphellophora attinorum]|uniref:J domain-containing protein n=1 Tax=Cyphellophora attinorum TaxID=1664694 RepID=A0A0N0NMX7_9EURO|nr:uncharacterized protein AB675_10831 [Phialophora attinorum]KPI40971.1 hypothetical protein AB675_10831 [Phialophora attinorum]
MADHRYDVHKDYYAILGISSEDARRPSKRNKAYTKLALKNRPNSAGGITEESFKVVKEAYTVLGDASARSDYDEDRRAQGYPNPDEPTATGSHTTLTAPTTSEAYLPSASSSREDAGSRAEQQQSMPSKEEKRAKRDREQQGTHRERSGPSRDEAHIDRIDFDPVRSGGRGRIWTPWKFSFETYYHDDYVATSFLGRLRTVIQENKDEWQADRKASEDAHRAMVEDTTGSRMLYGTIWGDAQTRERQSEAIYHRSESLLERHRKRAKALLKRR